MYRSLIDPIQDWMERAAASPGGSLVVSAAAIALFSFMFLMPLVLPRLVRGRAALLRCIVLEALLLAMAGAAMIYVIAMIDLSWSGSGQRRGMWGLHIACCFCVPWCVLNMWLVWAAKDG